MSIYKDCDIRGVYGTELTARDGYLIGRGLSTLHENATFLVGGDYRLSTPELKAALIGGLTAGGARVSDLGALPTPAFYFALAHEKATGGCMVTASHNPAKYNGVKFMLGDRPVTRETIDRLQRAVEGGTYREGEGAVAPLEVKDGYLADLGKRVYLERPLRVALDAGNGAMWDMAPEAFRRAGCEVIPVFCEPDGRFPNRSPNPADYEVLTALRETVVRERADFGAAFDGDGDRVVFVDEMGAPLASERAMALFIRHLLKDRPAPVVYDQKASSVVEKAVREMGGAPVMERSGHTFIKRRFLELNAPFAGEVSGHFFFGTLGYDDGLYAALLMAQMLLGAGAPLSEMAADITCPPITPDLRIFCPYDGQDDFLEKMAAIGKDGTITRLDGVRVAYPEGWILFRKSVTAEQITIRAEAQTKEALAALLEKFGVKNT